MPKIKITREQIIESALELLNSEGLDAVTTRKLAQRLQVESPALYWHFKDKAALFQAMSSAIMARYHVCPPPSEAPADQASWLGWYADNARSFRNTLLRYRDGARLHAGSAPTPAEREQLTPKLTYLMRGGLSEHQAEMALYIVSQLTLGAVLEEQARLDHSRGDPAESGVGGEAGQEPGGGEHAPWSEEQAFEFGLKLLLDGLGRHYKHPTT